jgi:F0F1-type ATP synthase membrane subunit c/vacuolar-type H+-ATPase subunit K
MLIGGIGYAGDSFIQLTLINSQLLSLLFSTLLVLAVIAEFWFAFWLLIKGINKEASA